MADTPVVPRVAFNAALLTGSQGYRAAGIHRYIAGLLGALSRREGLDLTVIGVDPGARSLIPREVRQQRAPRLARRPLGRIIWEQLALPAALSRLRADVLHAPAYAMPLAGDTPAVVTIHDLSFFRVPHTLGRGQAWYLRAATRVAVRRAAALIAVSDFTRRELVSLLNAAPERIHVVPNGIDPGFRCPEPDVVAGVRSELALGERYVLTVGTLQPRKNIGTLLDAYARLCREMDGAPDLVIAGGRGWGRNEVGDKVAALGIGASVRLLGYVADEHLPALYGGAALFALPSRYEGFGLPVIEAMACGTPTVVADAASLPEVAGDAAVIVPPDDVAAWAAAMRAVLESPDRAARLAEAGRRRAGGFTWAAAATATAAVYRQVCRGRSAAQLGPEAIAGGT